MSVAEERTEAHSECDDTPHLGDEGTGLDTESVKPEKLRQQIDSAV